MEHDDFVRRIAETYKRADWDVKADLSGYPEPLVIRKHKPDVFAEKAGEIRIFEVERTLDTLKMQGLEQVRDFLTHTSWVKVAMCSDEDKEPARRILREAGLTVRDVISPSDKTY